MNYPNSAAIARKIRNVVTLTECNIAWILIYPSFTIYSNVLQYE